MISKPDINISLESANLVQGVGARRDLIVMQTPSATANALVTGIQSKTQDELDSLLGAGSYARFTVQAWLDANLTGNSVKAELDMIVLVKGTVAATQTMTVVGSASADDTIDVSILSSRLFTKSVSVSSGDNETAIADAITAAFNSIVAPFTVGNTLGVVTVTATDLGTIGADYGIEFSDLPTGVTSITLAAGASGTGTPSVTNVMDLVGSRRYQGILWPSDLDTEIAEVVTDFLDDRFNASNEILDGVAFMGESNTLTLAKGVVSVLNSPSLVVVGNALADSGNAKKIGTDIVHPVDWTVAEFMAIRARRLTENASISSVVVTNASGDKYGGRSLASLPYFNTPLTDTPITDSVDLFNKTDQVELNTAGYSVVGPNRALLGTITGTMVTTYKKDAAGNDDASFKYLNYVDTASICREFIFNNLKDIFAQARLTDGDLVAGRSMENVASIKAVIKGLLASLKDDTLVRKGRVADGLINDSLTVVLDMLNRKTTVRVVLPIVTQLETVNMPLQLTFDS